MDARVTERELEDEFRVYGAIKRQALIQSIHYTKF